MRRTVKIWTERQVAISLLLLTAFPVGAVGAPLQPATSEDAAAYKMQSDTHISGADDPAAKQQTGAPNTASRQNGASGPPMGTAIAPAVKASGVPASKPAGVAIAPAKQKRVRTFAIRVGLLVGAGIAIGLVTAASMGSPSRP